MNPIAPTPRALFMLLMILTGFYVFITSTEMIVRLFAIWVGIWSASEWLKEVEGSDEVRRR